jgi:hypothetical protein
MNMLDAIAGWVMAFRHRKGDATSVEKKRRRWRSLAERHGLVFHPGPHRGYFQGDRLEGRIDGRHVRIQSDADYDLQKLVVTVSIECEVATPGARLSKHELVEWYEARALKAAVPPIDLDLAPWVLGRRAGVGAVLDQHEGRLIYLQLYEMDELTLEFLLAKLLRWAHQLELASRV